MKDNFRYREDNLLKNVDRATEKTKAALSMELESYKASKTVVVDDSNDMGGMENGKQLVRTRDAGNPFAGGTNEVKKSVDTNPFASNYSNVGGGMTQSSGPSQTGNASTNTLLLIFGLVLILLVFMISYCIFVYFGA